MIFPRNPGPEAPPPPSFSRFFSQQQTIPPDVNQSLASGVQPGFFLTVFWGLLYPSSLQTRAGRGGRAGRLSAPSWVHRGSRRGFPPFGRRGFRKRRERPEDSGVHLYSSPAEIGHRSAAPGHSGDAPRARHRGTRRYLRSESVDETFALLGAGRRGPCSKTRSPVPLKQDDCPALMRRLHKPGETRHGSLSPGGFQLPVQKLV